MWGKMTMNYSLARNEKGLHPQYPIEKTITEQINLIWIKNNWPQTFYWSAIYMMVIFSLQNYMKSRPAFNLRRPLIIWNLLLAVFSIFGTVRMLPGLYIVLRDFGFNFSVCNISFAKENHPVVLWLYVFMWSKVFEFGDTLFIVLRKQKLIFLHWYHHVATLIFTWYNVAHEISTGYWFCTMNYFVHSFMYTYYAMKAMKVSVPRYIAMCITISQILQMFAGCFVTILAFYNYQKGEYCEQTSRSLCFAFLLYFTYVIMFCHLFYNLYVTPKAEKLRKSK
ncbi:very long chain fatty acid elongase 6-like isoform X2 [Centruroides vittatus]|uniref:elongation of very long chain fatty acids protein 6-like isoform X1 n=1 Tax=Centruroides sculpturatus TaxID=218467 RepID=UPI000C6CAF84|nr:elongation of very long chain fatty acids protein 6-like isoform X1 [Centruroides sculpturatus]